MPNFYPPLTKKVMNKIWWYMLLKHQYKIYLNHKTQKNGTYIRNADSI